MSAAHSATGPASCVVTFFPNFAASSKRQQSLTLRDLGQLIAETTGPTKADLPWLKMAIFGNRRTAKGSLRHDANLASVTGLEADYDRGIMSFEEAVQRLHASKVLAIAYTSPSHSPAAPRWRVLCPLSTEYPPEERDRLMARLNGLFDGVFSNESWTRSQSYYFGSVNSNPAHRVAVVADGRPIDLAAELDIFAVWRAERAPKPNGAAPKPNGQHGPVVVASGELTSRRLAALVNSLLDTLRAAADGAKHTTLLAIGVTLGGYLHHIGWSREQAIEALVGALPATVKDWAAARTTAGWAIDTGLAKPLELEDRPGYPRLVPDPAPVPAQQASSLRERPDVPPVGSIQGSGRPDPDPEPPPEPEPEDGPPDDWEDIPGLQIEPGSLITEQFAMRTFINAHHEQLRFNHSSGTWLVWSDHYWRPDERKLAFSWSLELCRELARTIDGKDATKGRLVVEKVRFSAAVEQGARTMPQVATAQGDWDANQMLLGTPGGVVDLKTGELRDGQRTDMISRTTSVTPSREPDCPEWIKFLNYALHDDDKLVRFVQRYFGYCLTGVTIEEVFLFMFGPGGAGKGTMVETVAHIMGDYASTVPMEVFTGQKWSPNEYYRADMAGKRLIVANEPERGAYWAEAFIKETTGGDTLSGRHPMGRPFRYKPSHKMAMQGNHMPRLRGQSTGMQRRLRILPVTRKPVTPDANLKAKLMAEGPGILRWQIEGCLAWQRVGLSPPDAVLTAGSKYFDAQDVFARWLEECCDLGAGLAMETGKLRADYNRWARSNGEDEMNGNAFAEAIDHHEPPFKRGKGHAGKRLVWGIGLKATEVNDNWQNRDR